MISIALCSSLVGATLGMRLRVFVLLPVGLIGGVMVAVATALGGATASSVVGDIAVGIICLQMGYLGGLLTRFCLAAARSGPSRRLSSTVVRS
jgi:hypothetical protein